MSWSKLKNKDKVLFIVFLIIVICIFTYLLRNHGFDKVFGQYKRVSKGNPEALKEIDKDKGWGIEDDARIEASKAANDIQLPEVSAKYTDKNFDISFNYPKDFEVTSFTEGNSEGVEDDEYIILAQDAKKNIGIQISVMKFTEPINSLTKERIESDLGIKIENYSIIKIGKNNNIQAVTFLNGDNVKYREVWFIKSGSLFMVKAYQSSESLIEAILKTLTV